jgi:hypothetical protein
MLLWKVGLTMRTTLDSPKIVGHNNYLEPTSWTRPLMLTHTWRGEEVNGHCMSYFTKNTPMNGPMNTTHQLKNVMAIHATIPFGQGNYKIK